jgi:hypothetical protein
VTSKRYPVRLTEDTADLLKSPGFLSLPTGQNSSSTLSSGIISSKIPTNIAHLLKNKSNGILAKTQVKNQLPNTFRRGFVNSSNIRGRGIAQQTKKPANLKQKLKGLLLKNKLRSGISRYVLEMMG